MKKEMLQIQSKTSVMQVLGCLIKSPTLLIDSNYHIGEEDFCEKFHKILFGAINNLFNNGTMVMDIPTICNYIYNFPSFISVFELNNGTEYIEMVSETSELENFEQNYKMMKKYTILRDLASNGVDISDVYDYRETDPDKLDKQQKRMLDMTSSDILDHFMIKLNDIIQKHDMEDIGVKKIKASDRVRDVIESFKNTPDIGMKMYNEWYNTAFRGGRLGKFILESSGSGNGKSRRQIREAVYMSVPYLYNLENKQWEETGVIPVKTTYICTELEEDEIIPIAVAFLSGVNEEKIKMCKMNEDEAKRVAQAIDIMETNDNFHMVTISDFDVDDIEKIIVDKILREGCKYFFFDYIHSTAKSLSCFARKTGIKLQEHQVLFLMAVSLKSICQKYKIFLYSATQINQSGMSGETRDEQALRGSKAIVDKVDGGVNLSRVDKKDLDKLKDIIAHSFGKTPTHCSSIYKNRGGSIRGVYLWSDMNLGTMRERFLFATDDKYNPIAIEMLDIVMKEEEENEKDKPTKIEYIEEEVAF